MKIDFIFKMKMTKDKKFNLVFIIALINILLAVLALIKDMFMASYMGTTDKSDAFALAFFITDMFGNNLIASAAAVSSIPIFTKIYLNNRRNFYKSFITINIIFLILTSICVLCIFIFRDMIVSMLANGFSFETRILSSKLLVILLPTVIFYPIVTTGISYMQVEGKFIVSSLAAVLFNFVFFIGVAYCSILKISIDRGVYLVSFSVLFSVFAMFILVYFNITKQKIKFKTNIKSEMMANANLFMLFIPYLFILATSQFVLYYERYLASKFESGSVAALNYAFRLTQFPIWVFVAAIGTVVFPLMSKFSSSGDLKELDKVFKKALWWVLILTVPTMIMLYILRVPIITILFLRDSFDHNSLKITVEIFSGYIFAILGQSITAISMKLFLSREEMKLPFVVFIFSTIINIALDYYIVSSVGIGGLGYGAAISAVFNAIMMLYITKSDIIFYLGKNWIRLFKFILANLPVVLICFNGNILWNLSIIDNNFFSRFLFVGILTSLSVVSYVVSLKFLKLV